MAKVLATRPERPCPVTKMFFDDLIASINLLNSSSFISARTARTSFIIVLVADLMLRFFFSSMVFMFCEFNVDEVKFYQLFMIISSGMYMIVYKYRFLF